MSDLIERMRLLELDHEPEGWPAVQMRDISALCDAIDRASGLVAEMVRAMHDYEMSVDEDAPYKRRAMMDRAHALLSATSQPEGQQGSVPEGCVAIPKDVAAAKGMYLVGYSWLKHNAPQELTTPQPKADESNCEWPNCCCVFDEPSANNCDHPQPNVKPDNSDDDQEPTGLKRPQPPKQEGSGDEH